MIKTLIEMWHTQTVFPSTQDQKIGLARFVNFYNTDKPHAGIDKMTPYQTLRQHFFHLKQR